MTDKNKSQNWVNTLAKLLPGIGAIIAGIFIPLIININAQKSRRTQLYTEIVSKREIADSGLRAKMFETLLKYLFSDTTKQKTNREKLTLLRLLALNFHESFDLKPLFESLESELTDKEKDMVKNIAKEIAGKQEAMLSQIKEGRVFEKILYKGFEEAIMVPPDGEEAYRGHRLGIEIIKIGENEDYVRLHVWDLPDTSVENIYIGDIVDVKFDLNYYDMPFIDNTKLFNNTRFAITFKGIFTDETEIERGNAVKIKVIFLPESYMSSRDRPYLEEMLNQLRTSKKGM